MAISDEQPKSGMRLVLERPREDGPSWCYAGEASTPAARYPVSVTVEADGRVSVIVEGDAGLADPIKLIVRAAFKRARDAAPEAPPPRRIQRWRSGK